MSRIEEVTPQALIDLYSLMSDDSQWAFLKLLGGVSLAEAPFLLTSQLTSPEQWRFSEMITGSEMMNRFFLFLQQEARRLARAQPSISDEEFDRQFHEQIKQAIETQAQHVGEAQQAILKQKRDRKSDPETVLRNVKICNLRKQDQKKWSYRRLAREFKMTPQAIGLVLKGEAKWRRLATSAK